MLVRQPRHFWSFARLSLAVAIGIVGSVLILSTAFLAPGSCTGVPLASSVWIEAQLLGRHDIVVRRGGCELVILVPRGDVRDPDGQRVPMAPYDEVLRFTVGR
jgi:hypothetical protein